MAKKPAKVASPRHALLLLKLQEMFAEMGKKAGREKPLPIKEGMKLAGGSEQLYNQWQHGASPRLITLETMSKNLERPLHEFLAIEVRPVVSPQKASPETLAVGIVLDQITDPHLRAAVANRLIAIIPTLLADETSKLVAATKRSRSAR